MARTDCDALPTLQYNTGVIEAKVHSPGLQSFNHAGKGFKTNGSISAYRSDELNLKFTSSFSLPFPLAALRLLVHSSLVSHLPVIANTEIRQRT